MADRAAADEFIAYLQDQLRAWAPVASRRMFSGHGLYRGDTIFALVLRDALYFRGDPASRADFLAAGMAPFRYDRQGKSVSMAYYEVPADLLEDADALAAWADKAYAAALRVAAAKPKPVRQRPQRQRPQRPAQIGDKPARKRVTLGEE